MSWEYPARPDTESHHSLGVVDGDTLDLQADLGMMTYRRFTLRLADVDTAEIFGPNSSALGGEHAQFVADWMQEAVDEGDEWPLTVETTEQTGKYGRYVGHVIRNYDGRSLEMALIDEFGKEVQP